jgi:hypothetical protein
MDNTQRTDVGGRLLRTFLAILEWLGWCVVVPIAGVAVWAVIEPHGNMWLPAALLTAIPFSLFGAWRAAKRPTIRRSFILAPIVVLGSVAVGLATTAGASAVVALGFFLHEPP